MERVTKPVKFFKLDGATPEQVQQVRAADPNTIQLDRLGGSARGLASAFDWTRIA